MTLNALCIFCAGTGGGSGTLAIRIATWCDQHCIRFCYCNYVDSNPLNTATLKENNARLETRDDKSFFQQFDAVYEQGYKYTVMVYTLEDYYKAEKIQKQYPAIKRILLYVVLPDGLCYKLRNNTLWGERLSRLVTRTVNKRYIKKLIESGCLLFMDEQCLEQTKKMTGLVFPDKNSVIARLPYEITDYDGSIADNISRGEVFTISTGSRLDFPFKGYVIGLIRIFAKLKEHYPELKLIIVGDGKDSNVVKETVCALEPDIRKDIELTGMLSYLELKEVFARTDLYIGMGTTLLDAADSLTPAMVAAAFTYDFETIGMFNEYPEKLGVDSGDKKSIEIIQDVVKMSDSQYFETVVQQYDNLKRMYDIDTFMEKVLEYKMPNYCLTDEPILSAIYEFFLKILKMRRCIKRSRRKRE